METSIIDYRSLPKIEVSIIILTRQAVPQPRWQSCFSPANAISAKVDVDTFDARLKNRVVTCPSKWEYQSRMSPRDLGAQEEAWRDDIGGSFG